MTILNFAFQYMEEIIITDAADQIHAIDCEGNYAHQIVTDFSKLSNLEVLYLEHSNITLTSQQIRILESKNYIVFGKKSFIHKVSV